MSALEAGLATLPAAAGHDRDHAADHAARRARSAAARAVGARASCWPPLGFAALAFVEASWAYAAFVLPLVVLAVGLGIANGPASSGSTAAVPPTRSAQASGISNMARYVGAAVAVAAIATI